MQVHHPALPDFHAYERAVQVLQSGGIVAYPTETFYGLAVDPENAQAVSALYRLKQRESRKPLSLLVPDRLTLSRYTSDFSEACKLLSNAFWPGPLTLVVRTANPNIKGLCKEDSTLAIRISSHPVAAKFCRLWGGAITASSANISGQPALSTAAEVRKLWGEKIDYVLDGGTTPGKSPSTIVRCDGFNCRILRHGVISFEDIRNVLPNSYNICNC